MSEAAHHEPQGLALRIFQERYTLHDQETFPEACDRLAAHVSAAEQSDRVLEVRRDFAEVLKRNLFMPGGRIWYGSGRPKGQLLNCFVIPTEDSREGWGKTFYDETVICGTGGGLGVNFSPTRPRGSIINGQKGPATGAVSEMTAVDAIGNILKAGGGRRTALMFALALTHGDIVEFLDEKLDKKKLNNANVSVWFDEDPEKFFELIRSDGELELKHQGRVINRISARMIWDRIISNALKGGEPGMLNGYLFNRMSNIWYHSPIICTNPCGEIGLCGYDCCCLGALVLPRFVSAGKMMWDVLRSTVRTAVRFLDDVLTVNNYPLPEIRETCQTIRRIGLGVMGLHSMLIQMGLRYSSPEGLELVDKVMAFIKNTAYEMSTELAAEKGPFPAFDAERFLKGGFAKTLKPSIRALIRERGIRNCAMLTIAPTGTTALVCDVEGGIEPLYAPVAIRTFFSGDKLEQELSVHPLFKAAVEAGEDVSHFQGCYDLRLRDHFEMQRTCQRHLDNACSKTINVLPGTSADELSELYMEFFPELKGVTIYPEGSRENQPLTPVPTEEAIRLVREGNLTIQALSFDNCKDGKCDI